jgi:sugar phosphate isomerase/epimerase
MTSRRDFIRQSGLLSTAILANPSDLFNKKKTISTKVGLQLYTLRNELSKDAKGTIEKVAKIGYKEIESFGYNGKYFGMDPKDFAAFLKNLGLTTPSGHYGLGQLSKGWEKAIEDAQLVGQKYMVLAYLQENERQSLDDYKKVADRLNSAGKKCKAGGIQLCYHNHDFEFKDMGGGIGYDILTKNTDPNAVKFEVDLYWATKAKQDPIEMFKKQPGRFPLWHVKDMDGSDQHGFTEVGNGTINFKDIFAQASTAGMKHFFVEQDECNPGPPLTSIETSYKYITTHLVK